MIARLLLVCLPCLLLCGCTELFHRYYVNYGDTRRNFDADAAICESYATQVQPFVYYDTSTVSGGWATFVSGQNNMSVYNGCMAKYGWLKVGKEEYDKADEDFRIMK